MRASSDRGQVTILIIGFAVVVILLIAVVVSASTAFLQRRSLMAWADGAALTAVQIVAEESVYAGTVGATLPLSSQLARRSVADYAARNRLGQRFDSFQVTSVAVDAPRGVVTVTFRAVAELPFAGIVGSTWADGQPIEATATATAPLSR